MKAKPRTCPVCQQPMPKKGAVTVLKGSQRVTVCSETCAEEKS